MSRFKEGLYDQLVTRSVRDFLDRDAGQNQKSCIDELEETDSPEYLARHIARQIKGALRGLPAEDRKRRQIELANALLEFVRERADSHDADTVFRSPARPSFQRCWDTFNFSTQSSSCSLNAHAGTDLSDLAQGRTPHRSSS